jgi:hypothetical protein
MYDISDYFVYKKIFSNVQWCNRGLEFQSINYGTTNEQVDLMESKKHTRVSLLMIDRLMQNDLSDTERLELGKKIEENQELKNYILQNSDLHSNLQFSKLQLRLKNRNVLTLLHHYFAGKLRCIIHTPVMSTVVVAMLLLMIVGSSFLIQRNNQQQYLGIKGGAYEVQLLTKGKSYSTDQVIYVADKDTISFLYRSPENMYVLLLYSEDYGVVKPFQAECDYQVWNASLTEKIAPMSIELEGVWKKQVIWVVTSRKKISIHKAESIIKKHKTLPAKVYTFYLTK